MRVGGGERRVRTEGETERSERGGRVKEKGLWVYIRKRQFKRI